MCNVRQLLLVYGNNNSVFPVFYFISYRARNSLTKASSFICG